jgi:2-oxoglutarate dehydrogenase E1 component
MPFLNRKWTDAADTAVPAAELKRLSDRITQYPEKFKPHPLVEKVLADRAAMGRGEINLDWGMGEHLAFASLVSSGYAIRITGQDAGRGTFTHRHSVLHDQDRERWDQGSYVPLRHLSDTQADFLVIDSILNEEAVLAYEYGYACSSPNELVIWEAQFGDFANGAQTMIDQFIVAGEQKWNRMSGVTLLLPHGYEGQGPEHSSARLERFLQLSAELNIVVTNITTAANFFHALRRQLAWPFRKPLVNFSPKANLRLPATYSTLDEFTQGSFREVMDDQAADAASIKKVLFCSGKIYFDLIDKKNKEERNDVAVVRIEQLYPFPQKQIDTLQKKYTKATWFWVQEEPLNMGAASFLQMNLKSFPFGVISRQASASTATGYQKVHQQEQSEIIQMAFSI